MSALWKKSALKKGDFWKILATFRMVNGGDGAMNKLSDVEISNCHVFVLCSLSSLILSLYLSSLPCLSIPVSVGDSILPSHGMPHQVPSTGLYTEVSLGFHIPIKKVLAKVLHNYCVYSSNRLLHKWVLIKDFSTS